MSANFDALCAELARMESRGLIEALPAEDRRHPYRVTAAGPTAFREQLDGLTSLTQGVDAPMHKSDKGGERGLKRIGPGLLVLAAAALGVAVVAILQPWRASTDGDGSQHGAGDLTITWEAVWSEDTDVIVYDIYAVDGHLAMTASGFGPPRGMHAWFSAGEDRWTPAEVTPPDGGDPNGTADFGPMYVADGQLHTIGFTQDRVVRGGRETLFVSPDGGRNGNIKRTPRCRRARTSMT